LGFSFDIVVVVSVETRQQSWKRHCEICLHTNTQTHTCTYNAYS